MAEKEHEPAPQRAKLFWNGRSQAVRLPRPFRFEGGEVLIRKEGEAVVLEPVNRKTWPRGFWKWVERSEQQLELGELAALEVALRDVEAEE